MGKQVYGLASRKAERSDRVWWFLGFMIALAIAASIWMTQRIAEGYGYSQALGTPLWGNVYMPWQWCVWWNRHPDTWGIMESAMAEGTMIFVFPQIFLLIVLMAFSRRLKGTSDIHGSAHWATKDEVRATSLLNGRGVYVGGWLYTYTGLKGLLRRLHGLSLQELCYLRHDGPEHILAFAPTRSGKGVGLVLPTLLSWSGSALVMDIKGENWALTAGWRHQQGHKVLRFDPKDMDGTARFNPLEAIRLDGLEAVQDAQAVAVIILDPDGKGLQDYFDKAAFAFFTGAVLHCLIMQRQKGRVATMSDFALMLSDPDLTTDELLDQMIETDHAAILGKNIRLADALHTIIASSAQEMKNKADKERSGVLGNTSTALSLYRDPVIAHATSHSDFHVEDLMNYERPVTLYLVLAPGDLDRLRPMTRLFLNIILGRLTEHMAFENGRSVQGTKHRLLLMLDEFPSLGNLAIFERSLAYLAGYGIKCYLIAQDLSQLQKAYSKEEAIMSNCHIRIAYAPNKIETARLLSEMVGKTTVVETKTSLSGARAGHLRNASVSVQEVARPLLTPDECMALPGIRLDENNHAVDGGDMLVFVAGSSPVYGKQILYFKDPAFLRRAKIAAPAETDRLHAGVVKKAASSQEDSYETALGRVG